LIYNSRINRILNRNNVLGVEAYLIMKPENIYYLSGFSGSSAAIIIYKDKKIFLTDFRYMEQAKKQVKNFQIEEIERGLLKGISQRINENNIKKIAFESSYVNHSQYLALNKLLKDVEFVSDPGGLEIIRMIKSDKEIILIKDAINSAEKVLEEVLPLIVPGFTEREISSELEYRFRKFGGDSSSFLPIVAAGKNSACPHHVPTDYKFQNGDILKIDFGLKKNGYCSDMTRSFFMGNITKKGKLIYDIVLKAQEEAINIIQPGIKASLVDETARKIINNSGYGEYFGHGLGHGIGLEVHERPSISNTNNVFLRPGMIFTVEPGIYIPDFGGIRIEDIILVTDRGCENLSNFSKQISILCRNT